MLKSCSRQPSQLALFYNTVRYHKVFSLPSWSSFSNNIFRSSCFPAITCSPLFIFFFGFRRRFFLNVIKIIEHKSSGMENNDPRRLFRRLVLYTCQLEVFHRSVDCAVIPFGNDPIQKYISRNLRWFGFSFFILTCISSHIKTIIVLKLKSVYVDVVMSVQDYDTRLYRFQDYSM